MDQPAHTKIKISMQVKQWCTHYLTLRPVLISSAGPLTVVCPPEGASPQISITTAIDVLHIYKITDSVKGQI